VILLRSALFNLAFFALSVAMLILCLPLLLRRRWVRGAMRAWARAVIGLLPLAGVRLSVGGLANIPPGGAVIASNHQSAFDTIVWLALLPDAVYVMKRELLWVPLYGQYAARAAMIPVDRSGGGPALRRMLRAVSAAAAAGQQVVIFPEGTRAAASGRAAFRRGIVAVAAGAGVPIVPVATNSGQSWGRRAFRKRPGTIAIRVLPPLPAGLPRDAVLGRLAEAIDGGLVRLAQTPVEKPVEAARH
jgi:1-acyl-sn-glycerol-3-phosphate acyltransferase